MNISKELLKKAKTAKSAEELLEMAKAEKIELTEEEAAKYGARTATREEIFETCDIVSLHISLNEKTKGCINRELLEKLGASEKPVLYVFNKCDVAEKSEQGFDVPAIEGASLDDVFCISAKTGRGISALLTRLDQLIPEVRY